jgi:hypothetical protein
VKLSILVVMAVLLAPPGPRPTAQAAEAVSSKPRIEAGTRGVAKTVLRGTELVEIPVEFLGLYEDAIGPGLDLYLVRLSGSDADKVGVAAGMSGSPVYVDGEIVGALSYRIGFLPKEPIAGVTPIADMIAADRGGAGLGGAATGGVAPIATPLFLGGIARPVADDLRAEFEKLGFVMLMSGGGGSSEAAGAAPLVPGSPVAAALVQGDMSIAATGTVTWVDDDRVFAFGHPLLGGGRVDFPMARAEVVYTVPDESGSVKLATIGERIGAFREDRLTAIVGRMGLVAETIPVHLDVRGGDHSMAGFDVEIVKHPSLTPMLAGAVVSNALVLNLGFDQEATVRVDGQIRLRGLPSLPIRFALASGPGAHPYVAASGRIRQLFAALYGNPFAEVEVDGIDLTIDISRARQEYRLESIHYDRGAVRPGETLELTCLLTSFRGEKESRSMTIDVPRGITPGTDLSLIVGDPTSVSRVLGNPLARRLRTADSIESYVRILGDVPATDRIMAVLYRRATGAVSRGAALTALPPTAANLLGSQSEELGSGYLSWAPVASAGFRLDGPVQGSVRGRVEIDGSGQDAEEDE